MGSKGCGGAESEMLVFFVRTDGWARNLVYLAKLTSVKSFEEERRRKEKERDKARTSRGSERSGDSGLLFGSL